MDNLDFLGNTEGRLVHKWNHYFELYRRYFSKFKDKDIRLLEIGVSGGGSLRMWRNYFGKNSLIVGMDIDERCSEHSGQNIEIVIGNQNNKEDIDKIIQKYGNFDIIIDDGSHVNEHVINCFKWLFPILNDGGVYFIEDTHTSYWESGYNGGFRESHTMVEFTKTLIDHLTAYHFDNPDTEDKYYTNTVSGIYYHDSVIVFDKQLRKQTPFDILYVDGKKERDSAIMQARDI